MKSTKVSNIVRTVLVPIKKHSIIKVVYDFFVFNWENGTLFVVFVAL